MLFDKFPSRKTHLHVSSKNTQATVVRNYAVRNVKNGDSTIVYFAINLIVNFEGLLHML